MFFPQIRQIFNLKFEKIELFTKVAKALFKTRARAKLRFLLLRIFQTLTKIYF